MKDTREPAWTRGSFTVEASLVLSLTIFVLGALLLAGFYVHDRAVLQGWACEITAAGENEYGAGRRAQTVSRLEKNAASERLLGSRSLSKQVSVSEESASGNFSAVYPVPGFAAAYLCGGRLSLSAGWSFAHIHAGKEIWRIRGIGKLLDGGES